MSVKLDYSFFTELPLGSPYGEPQLQNPLFIMLAAACLHFYRLPSDPQSPQRESH